MEWKGWEKKKVFVRLRTGKVFSGVVKDIDMKSPPIIFITIIDKFNQLVTFTTSEIIELKEEEDKNETLEMS